MRRFGRHDDQFISQDPIYNFYRSAFRLSTLFNGANNVVSPTVNTYADAVVTDAFTTANNIELAVEAILTMNIYMKIVHTLTKAVSYCKDGLGEKARVEIEIAFAIYVGVGQGRGSADGYLYYSFTQRAASNFGTFIKETNEAKANNIVFETFVDAKSNADGCGPTSYQALRKNVGKIISNMNVPLVQQFLYLIEQNAYSTEETNYLELMGLGK